MKNGTPVVVTLDIVPAHPRAGHRGVVVAQTNDEHIVFVVFDEGADADTAVERWHVTCLEAV
jgi:hypothetical protein